MLPKKFRLTRQQFWQVSQRGVSVSGTQLEAKYVVNDLDYSRWAVVTSARLSKLATVRNKLRRRMYASVNAGVDVPVDVIMFPRTGMINLDDEKFQLATDQVVSKISRLVKRA